MKNTLLFVALTGLTMLASCEAKSQTNTSVSLPITIPVGLNIFTNFPDTTPDLALFSVSAGIITLQGSPENYIKGDLNLGDASTFLNRFRLGADEYNAPEASVIDAAGLYVGYRMMVASNYELTPEAFLRRYFATMNDGLFKPSTTGGVDLDARWRILQGNNLYSQVCPDIEKNNSTGSGGRWGIGLKVGLSFYFGKHF